MFLECWDNEASALNRYIPNHLSLVTLVVPTLVISQSRISNRFVASLRSRWRIGESTLKL